MAGPTADVQKMKKKLKNHARGLSTRQLGSVGPSAPPRWRRWPRPRPTVRTRRAPRARARAHSAVPPERPTSSGAEPPRVPAAAAGSEPGRCGPWCDCPVGHLGLAHALSHRAVDDGPSSPRSRSSRPREASTSLLVRDNTRARLLGATGAPSPPPRGAARSQSACATHERRSTAPGRPRRVCLPSALGPDAEIFHPRGKPPPGSTFSWRRPTATAARPGGAAFAGAPARPSKGATPSHDSITRHPLSLDLSGAWAHASLASLLCAHGFDRAVWTACKPEEELTELEAEFELVAAMDETELLDEEPQLSGGRGRGALSADIDTDPLTFFVCLDMNR